MTYDAFDAFIFLTNALKLPSVTCSSSKIVSVNSPRFRGLKRSFPVRDISQSNFGVRQSVRQCWRRLSIGMKRNSSFENQRNCIVYSVDGCVSNRWLCITAIEAIRQKASGNCCWFAQSKLWYFCCTIKFCSPRSVKAIVGRCLRPIIIVYRG